MNNSLTEQEVQKTLDEKEQLLATLKKCNVPVHPNTGIDKLRSMVAKELNPDFNEEEANQEKENLLKSAKLLNVPIDENDSIFILKQKIQNHLTNPVELDDKKSRIRKAVNDATKLVRCIVHNNDPQDAKLTGMIMTVGNKYTGAIKKYVPFSEQCGEEGYHLPQAIIDALKKKQYLFIRMKKEKGAVRETLIKKFLPKFNIEILPNLTKEELKQLAEKQALAGTFATKE